MEPLFSVVIPIYNMEQYLKECVNSVLSQIDNNKPTLEIILVDDGSTDRSGILCDEFANEQEMIKVIHQNNRGLLQARRTGYKVATGKYIINLDSDDMLMNNAISSLAEVTRLSSSDVIFYNISVLYEDGLRPYYKDVFCEEFGCNISKKQVLEAYFGFDIPVVTSMAGKVFKRDCLCIDSDYTGFGKLSMGEDTLQTAEIVSRASSFYYLNKNLYIYRMGSGMTVKYDPEYYKTFKAILGYVYALDGFVDLDQYRPVYYDKILSSGCRAITQSKCIRAMKYKDRRILIENITNDELFTNALKTFSLGKSKIKVKYKLILMCIRIRAYYAIHVLLKIT